MSPSANLESLSHEPGQKPRYGVKVDVEEAFRRLATNDLPADLGETRELVEVLDRYLTRCLGSIPKDSRRDIVQDVVVVVLEKGSTARNPKAWLARVALNRAKDCWRQESKQPKANGPALQAASGDAAAPWVKACHRCLDQLPGEEQLVITGQFLLQPKLSYRDLAEELGCSPSTIGQIRQRALKRLERCLEDQPINWKQLWDEPLDGLAAS